MTVLHQISFCACIGFSLHIFLPTTVLARESAIKEPVVLNVETFGAVGNGVHDDWPAFQRAIDRAAQSADGGTVIIPSPKAGGAWVLSRALRMRSLVTVQVTEPETRILCMGKAPAVWPETGCVMFGNYTAGKLAKVPSHALAPIAAGDKTVRLLTDESKLSFSDGEIVAITSSTSFSVGSGTDAYLVPTTLQVNRVESTSMNGQQLGLRYPMHTAYPAASIRKLNYAPKAESAPTQDQERWATYGSKLIGGTWTAAQGKAIPFAAAGGTLDCTIEPHTVSAYTGVGYGNMYAECRMGAKIERISGAAVELAFGSHNNTVSVSQIYMEESPNGVKRPPWHIGVNEGGNNNSISIDYMEVGSFGFDVIKLISASNNHVTVGNLSGQTIDGFVVRLLNGQYAGNPPTSVKNVITVKVSSIDHQRGYIANAAGNSNSVTGKFSGATVNKRN